MKEQDDSFVITIAKQKSQPSPPAPLNNMDFGRMHEIKASVSEYLVHFCYLVENCSQRSILTRLRRAVVITPVQREHVAILGACRDLEIGLATKIPKNGLKIVAEFLQKCSTNLRFHL